MNIRNIQIPHGLCLAPMAGYTDAGLRRVCRLWGAEYMYTEMVSAKAVVYGDRKTAALARIYGDEGPVAVQMFGNEEDILARAAEILSAGVPGYARPVAIDINMGCPVPKVYGNGDGSALMRDPELIRRIVRAVTASTDLPVTVKLRAGIDRAHVNAVECALATEDGGAAAVAVHGRTRAEMYAGRADRTVIRDVKAALQIPVIANGDITSAAEAENMLRMTGADGLMIARGAIGNPFVFSEILAAIDNRPYTPPSPRERMKTALLQLDVSVRDKTENLAVTESRKQMAAYLTGFRGAAALRADIHRATCRADIERILDEAVLLAEEQELQI